MGRRWRIKRAIVVEDDPIQTQLVEHLLGAAGFGQVLIAQSLPAGRTLATTLLAPAAPAVPTFILLDLMLPHPDCPDLEGTLLAAALSAEMEDGTVQPCPIAAYSSDLTDHRYQEAIAAGCRLVFPKPLTLDRAIELWQILQDDSGWRAPPPLSLDQRLMRDVMRRSLRQLSPFLTLQPRASDQAGAGDCTWDHRHARLLLFKPGALVRKEPWRSWLAQRGGYEYLLMGLAGLPLRPGPRELWALILQRRTADWEPYANELNIAKSTYFKYLHEILDEVIARLNP